MLNELRYAVRQLRKSPGFAITAVLTLAIGIGANTAMFSMMDGIVLRPLAVPDLNRVMTVDEQLGNGVPQRVALANYEDWSRQTRSFEDMAVRTDAFMSLTGAGDPAHVQATWVSSDFFRVMRAEPLIGRVFLPSECRPGQESEAVLSYGFWRKQFGGESPIVGRALHLDGRSYSVIGVMPRAVQYPSMTDVFLPLAAPPPQLANRSAHDFFVIGRLRPGVTPKQAGAELQGIAARLEKQYPATNQGWSAHLEPLLDDINGEYTPLYLRMVMGATLFVLLIVCVNVANLQFARGIERRPEMAMRSALGAGRTALIRQLLLENVVLALIGAAGGIGIAVLDLHISLISMPDRVARYMSGWVNISLNGHVLLFSLLLAIGAGVVAGVVPAIDALRLNLVEQLKAGSRTSAGTGHSHRLRNLFAAAQVALAVVLVAGAALMVKGTEGTLRFGDRYQPKQTLTFLVHLPSQHYNTPQDLDDWYAASLAKLRALPGVQQAAVTTTFPWGDYPGWTDVRIDDRPVAPGKLQRAACLVASNNYLSAMRIDVERGRTFDSGDGLHTQPVALISRAFAHRYFPDENPVGHHLRLGRSGAGDTPALTVVGVTGETIYEWGSQTASPAVMVDAAQFPENEMRFALVTRGNPLQVASAAGKVLAEIDPTIPLDGVQTYEQMLHEAFCGLLYAESMLAVDAAIALLLAAIGIFGVMANLVAERRREIGVRLALGARRQDVLRSVFRRAAWLTGAGLGIGLVLAGALTRLVANLLVGVSPHDPVVFGGISAAVITVAFAATWLPARQAAGTDPMEALREE